MENKITTIYCCYHNEVQNDADSQFVWINGADDPLNKFLCEFSAFRKIYETDMTSSYIGFCHYRRKIFKNDIDYNWVDNDHCIAYSKMQHYPGSVNDCYGIRRWSKPTWCNCRNLYFDWIDYIRQIGHTEYFEGDELTAKLGLFITHSCCVMPRYHFMNMCSYILGYFDYIDEKYQFNKMPSKYNEYTSNHIIDYSASWMGTTRLFAYLGEWLVSNYIVTKFNQNSIKYLHKHDYLTN